MITVDGYSISYDRSGNRITILLPQTAVTMTNTMAMMSNRKTDFTDAELATILYAVKAIAEGVNKMRLIDADLVKRIICQDQCELPDGCGASCEITDYIEAAPTVGGWVSVKDRMPNDGQDVLAYLYNGEETRIAPFNYDKGTWYDCVMNCTVAINSITHWMPLPEPPNDVNLKRPDCEHAEHDGTGCLGYCGCTQDDEPIEFCKRCEKYTGNVSEAVSE